MRKKTTTSERLRQIMAETGMKQVDILRKSKPYCEKYNMKLNRNDLSQYVSGKIEPGQKKLMILAETLEVNPTWLMGLDVSKSKNTNNNINTFTLGSEISKIFNQVSNDLNIPIEDLKKVFFNDSNNSNKELNYDNLLSFFKEYFKNKIKK